MVKFVSSLFQPQNNLPLEGKYKAKKAWLHYVGGEFLLISKSKKAGKKLFKIEVSEWTQLKKKSA